MNRKLPLVITAALSAFSLAAWAQVQVNPAPPIPVGGRSGRGAPAGVPADPASLPAVPADQLKGKLVSLNVRDVPLREALQQLQSQGGVQVNMNYRDASNPDPGSKHVTLEVKEKPVWETMLALLKQADADDPINASCGMPPNGNIYVAGRASAVGPFLVVARNITHDSPVQPSGMGPDASNLVRVDVQVALDQSLRISRLNSTSIPTRATDDKGNNLVPPQPPQTANYMILNGSSFSAPNGQILLQYPAANVEPGRKIAVLEGFFAGTVTTTETLEVGSDKKAERTFGTGNGIKVTIQWGSAADIATNSGRPLPTAVKDLAFGVAVHMEADAALPQAEWNTWQQAGNPQVKLVDAAGLSLQLRMSTSPSSGRTRDFLTFFASGAVPDGRGGMAVTGDPAKAIIDLPVSPKSIQIAYHFENLPLP